MIAATICIIFEGDPPHRVLLGHKQIGFGAGKIVGYGGKLEPGETPAACAVREVREESGLILAESDLNHAAHATFLFPARPEWDHAVHIFTVDRWQGQLIASAEITPAWFAIDAIPYERMWRDSAHWLPRILAGERLQATYVFAEDNETLEQITIHQQE